jgi:60 kDa SS-A/Ro ribonucleoprotein
MERRIDNRARLTRLATPQVERHRGTWLLTRSTDVPQWPADEWERLDRYLIFGGERDAHVVRGRLAADGPRVVRRIVELSAMGRVVSTDPCLMVLAMSLTLGNKATRVMAREAAPEVARTREELRQFEQYVNAMRGTAFGATPGFHRGGERGAVVHSARPPRTRGGQVRFKGSERLKVWHRVSRGRSR